ncbi:protein FAR-RED IMPAIRED RESPONSE 1-like [Telopea speciosissima]|uniref:protein FAR-RED IMPAIRED RESPONSE 1-like n=1 Tax=Telopea speciosissima TaxID=54955 RepID=UPI001CC3A30C|nr:protein FAR-RED IMPAIRED RESPONSE 1-like [Telopea speciosissima]
MEIDLEGNVNGHEIENVRSNMGESTDGEVHGEDELGESFPVMDLEEDTNFEPSKGMEFESHEEAYAFYKQYARSVGFSTKKKNSRRSRLTGKFIDAHFACSRQGNKQQSEDAIKRRPSCKSGCKASMHVKRRQDGRWIIHNFTKEHNHELLPSLTHYFRSGRSMNLNSKNNLDILHAVRIQTSKIYTPIAEQCGASQSGGFLDKDIRNQMNKGGCLAIEAEDAHAMLDHFIQLQQENPNFFYAIDLNDEQRLRNVFWVDAKGRHDCISFNDVVSLDTTYLKKRCKMPFAPFMGVNHHFQSMLVGCALLADETSSTFVWLLRTWLRAMGGVTPRVIITDQDEGMKSAVAEVLPDAQHRYCLWHILRKIPEKLSHVTKKSENFIEEFNKCIYRSWTEEEFENRWWNMVHTFELKEDEWIESLYEDRKQWVPTYMKDTFYAGMSTTQRSESVNSFFDKYVLKKTTLKEFLENYKSILQDRYEEESRADFDSKHGLPALKSHSPYEKQMSTIYTHELFKKFQVEVLGTVACHPRKEKEDGTKTTFRVQDFEAQEDFIVMWNETKSEVSCLCRSFEYKGFLCRHAMVVLQFSAIPEIPCHYILKRWSKDATIRHTMGQNSEHMQSREQRYNDLCQRALKLAIDGSASQESYITAVRALEEAMTRCAMLNISVQCDTNVNN